MLFYPALLATLILAPQADQPTLSPLKEIGHVRSTPLCSSLRTSIGPAVAHLLANDKELDAALPVFANVYVDDVIIRSKGWTSIDLLHMENRIGPIVQNLSAIDDALHQNNAGSAPVTEPKLTAMRSGIEAAVREQKAALNVISGFVDTYQLGSLQNSSLDNPWAEKVFFASRGGQSRNYGPGRAFGANALLSAGISGGAIGRMPMFDPSLAALGNDPYRPFAQAIVNRRSAEGVAESALAQTIDDVVRSCRAP